MNDDLIYINGKQYRFFISRKSRNGWSFIKIFDGNKTISEHSIPSDFLKSKAGRLKTSGNWYAWKKEGTGQ